MYTLMSNIMARFLTITETRKQLLELPDQLADEPVIVTRHGKPTMVALSYEQYESLLETIEILSDQAFAAQLTTSIAQAESGETLSLESAIASLGL